MQPSSVFESLLTELNLTEFRNERPWLAANRIAELAQRALGTWTWGQVYPAENIIISVTSRYNTKHMMAEEHIFRSKVLSRGTDAVHWTTFCQTIDGNNAHGQQRAKSQSRPDLETTQTQHKGA